MGSILSGIGAGSEGFCELMINNVFGIPTKFRERTCAFYAKMLISKFTFFSELKANKNETLVRFSKGFLLCCVLFLRCPGFRTSRDSVPWVFFLSFVSGKWTINGPECLKINFYENSISCFEIM